MDPDVYLKLWKFFRFDFENLITKFLAGRSWSRDAFEVLMNELHVYAYFHSCVILPADQTVDLDEALEVTIKLLLKTAKEVWLQPYFIAPELKAKYDEREAERKLRKEQEKKQSKDGKEEEEVNIPDNWLEMKRRIAGLYLVFLLYQHQPRLWEDYLPIAVDLSDVEVIKKFAADLKAFDIRMDDLKELKNEVLIMLWFLRKQAFQVVASTEEYGSELTAQYDDAREAEAKFGDTPKAWKEDFVFNSKFGKFVADSKTSLKDIVSDFNKAVKIAKDMAQHNHETSSKSNGAKAENKSKAKEKKGKEINKFVEAIPSVAQPSTSRCDSSLDFLGTYQTSPSGISEYPQSMDSSQEGLNTNKNESTHAPTSSENCESSVDFLDLLLGETTGSEIQVPTNSQTTMITPNVEGNTDIQSEYSYSSVLDSLNELMTSGESTTTTTDSHAFLDNPEPMDTSDEEIEVILNKNTSQLESSKSLRHFLTMAKFVAPMLSPIPENLSSLDKKGKGQALKEDATHSNPPPEISDDSDLMDTDTEETEKASQISQPGASSEGRFLPTFGTQKKKRRRRKKMVNPTTSSGNDSGIPMHKKTMGDEDKETRSRRTSPAKSAEPKTPFNWDTMTLKEKTDFALNFQATMKKASVLQGQMENLHELMLKLVLKPVGELSQDLCDNTPSQDPCASASTTSQDEKKGKGRKPRASRAKKPPAVLELKKDEESMNVVLGSFGFDLNQIKIPKTKVKTPEIPITGIEKYLDLQYKTQDEGVNTDPPTGTDLN